MAGADERRRGGAAARRGLQQRSITARGALLLRAPPAKRRTPPLCGHAACCLGRDAATWDERPGDGDPGGMSNQGLKERRHVRVDRQQEEESKRGGIRRLAG
ncbi:unnamed protein product [Lampetra planeri]